MSDETKANDQGSIASSPSRDPDGVAHKLAWLDNLPDEWRGVWDNIQQHYAPTLPHAPVDLLERLKKAYQRGYDSVMEPRPWLGGHWTECDQEEAEFALLDKQHGRGICSIVAELLAMGAEAIGAPDNENQKQTPVLLPKDLESAPRVYIASDLIKKLAQVVLNAEDKCDSWDGLIIIEAGVGAVIAELATMGGSGLPTWQRLAYEMWCAVSRREPEARGWVGELSWIMVVGDREARRWGRAAKWALEKIAEQNAVNVAQIATIAEQAKEIEYLRNPGATMRTVGDDKLLVCDGCSKIVTEPHGWIECCNTMRGSVASYERMIQQECDAYRDDVARLKAEVEAKTQRDALLVKAHKAALYANAKLVMEPQDIDLEYAAIVIESDKRTDAWERAVLEYVAIEDAQKEGRK